MSREKQPIPATNPVETIKNNPIESQILAEYNALRSEVIHRMQIRHQLVSLTVIVLGAVFAFDGDSITFLVYPILGFFIALGWAHNDFRVGEIGEYIRSNIECELPGIRWEQHFFDQKDKKKPFHYLLRASILSAGGIIVGTQVISLVIVYIQESGQIVNKPLCIIDVVLIIFTIIIMHWRKVLYIKKKYL